MSRPGRWLAVRIVAWAMRRGLDTAIIDEALHKSHPHQDWDWRQRVYDDARARVQRKSPSWAVHAMGACLPYCPWCELEKHV